VERLSWVKTGIDIPGSERPEIENCRLDRGDKFCKTSGSEATNLDDLIRQCIPDNYIELVR
jgi:hypothetical protein